MNKISICVNILVGFLLALPVPAAAHVDEESIFQNARIPVSQLDLRMSDIEKQWMEAYVISPDVETKRKYPLVTQAGVGIDLYLGDDRILATGKVYKLDGFLKLSEEERKQLLLNTLGLVVSWLSAILVDKSTGLATGKLLENRHIELTIIINGVTKNDRNESVLLLLPFEIGIGQAGYKDGQFVFSETYYLKLKVDDGLAVSGGPSKFIIER